MPDIRPMNTPKLEKRGNRGERRKSLVEILRTEHGCSNGGWRARRTPKGKAITWKNLVPHISESEEAAIS
ncbi:hypothetical protein Ancab_022560, partial [Ancistrocladus abbreviatus]